MMFNKKTKFCAVICIIPKLIYFLNINKLTNHLREVTFVLKGHLFAFQ